MNPYSCVFDALNTAGVRYVVVGGFAAVMHGCNRFTADLDLIIDLEPDEARRAIEGLLTIGLRSRVPVDPLLFADRAQREAWARDKGRMVFSLFHPVDATVNVDLFAESPIDFDALYIRSQQVTIDKTAARICGLDDLIEMKQRAGRSRDLQDIADLHLIRESRRKGNVG